MSTSPLTSNIPPSLAGSGGTKSNAASAAASNASSPSSSYSLSPSDFINLIVTQLKNQDPLSPTSNSELLTQVSQIGQLQSSNTLTSTLKSQTLQSQIGSASSLIGKSVTGIDGANKTVSGVVQSVSVSGSDVTLNLENGDGVAVTNLSSIAPSPAGPAAPAT